MTGSSGGAGAGIPVGGAVDVEAAGTELEVDLVEDGIDDYRIDGAETPPVLMPSVYVE